MVVNYKIEGCLSQKEFLQPGPIAHIQPGIGADKNKHSLAIEQAQGAYVKISIQV
jgi:hypothetical protein